jgi:hypothetical protein
MVGTVQERKGVDLFSRVADLAADRHPDWRFEWAGAAPGPLPPEVHRSDRVAWLGRLERDRITELLAASDVFFLSSRDDPMPLAALEAIGAGLRVVSSERVGAFELLSGAQGYTAFAEPTPEAALRAIESALTTVPDPERWREVRARFTVEAFAERMRGALGIGSTADTPPAPLPHAVPPAFPLPAEALLDPSLSPALRAVLRRAAERHAVDRAARLRLAERLLTGGDPRGARQVLADAGVRRVPEALNAGALTALMRRESGGRLRRLVWAFGRRSLSWGRRLGRLSPRR